MVVVGSVYTVESQPKLVKYSSNGGKHIGFVLLARDLVGGGSRGIHRRIRVSSLAFAKRILDTF